MRRVYRRSYESSVVAQKRKESRVRHKKERDYVHNFKPLSRIFSMLRGNVQMDLRNAQAYFSEHLRAGDYYAEGQQIAGEWFGLGAEMLDLRGKVSEAEFVRLCEGLNPKSGERLALRKNSTRETADGKTVANRRIFYDFTISPPKSVSILALMQDVRILDAHDCAVKITMRELEKFAQARVRRAGEQGERSTHNVVAATFRHDTSRELDPHLHSHCIVFNATYDTVENRWKALEAGNMYRAQKFAENLYYHELCKGLQSLGYEIESNRRDFEIKGISATLVAKFSKRHQQIDQEFEKLTEKHGLDANMVRRQIAQNVRKRKTKDATADKLRPFWSEQMTDAERRALACWPSNAPAKKNTSDLAAVIAWADTYLFERRSVAYDHELWSAALARGRGENFDLEALRAAIDHRGYVRQVTTGKLASREVLRCELEVVMAAKDGQRRFAELNSKYVPAPNLSLEQKKAAEQILRSKDLITLFRGGAGTGKSYTLKEIERGLSAAGHPIVIAAPQRQQVHALEADGLKAETLSALLERKEFLKGAVLIVDEAGQIGARQMRQLIARVRAISGRIILSGDTRQHGAVAASDALHAIEKYSGLRAAEIRKIRRQDPKLGATAKERRFIRSYRTAVQLASKGLLTDSFDRLEKIGCIQELPPAERRERVAAEYLAANSRNETTVVVAQTRDEVKAVNEVIRAQLQRMGKLGSGETLMVSQPIDFGEAEKCDPRFYHPGQQIFFLRSYGRFKRGQMGMVVSANEHGLEIEKDQQRTRFSYRYTDRIVVADPAPMLIATGDRLQMKFNGKAASGGPISNGELVTVRRVSGNGQLEVEGHDGKRKVLSLEQRLFVRGYALTSYGSQGKTVDTVILADSGNRAATNSEQWYVSISRGRKKALIFTSDKEALRQNIGRTGHRELALELGLKARVSTEQIARPELQFTAQCNYEAWQVLENARCNHFMDRQILAKSSVTKIKTSL